MELMKHKVSGTRFATSRNHSNPNGLLDFLKTENDVLHTLCFIGEMTHPACYFHEIPSDFAYDTQGFATRFATSRNYNDPNELIDFLKERN